MPTRPYKQNVQAESLKNIAQNNKTATSNLSQERERSTKSAAVDALDRLLLYSSDELKLRERHCLFPAFNVGQTPLNDLSELSLHLKCKVSVPSAVYIADKHCERVDICHRRTMAREIYRKRLHISRTRYQTGQKNKKLKTNEKEGSFHTSFFDLARRLDCDPDPYFHGSYDYYYSGGNLCILDDGEHVLHVDNNKLNNLNVGILPKFKSFAGSFLDPICSQQVDTEEEIFEVRAIQSLRKDCPNSFAVRQRNMITLYKFLPTGSAKALTRFKTSCTPFISFAQSPIDYSTFIITTMKQRIRVYDINASTPILSATHNVCKTEDIMRASWNMIRPWQGQTFLYANEKKLFMLDTRTCPEQWLKSSCGYATQDYKCDFISSIAKSEFRDLAYVATNHKLHCLDLRYLGGDIESGDGALCRWTHQLQYAPAFIDNFRFGGVEFIALS
ncbi:PREDICTED: uncharacterized protein LOC108381495, partial [Rhagoletis zephyria]|uniref:uncharacterized protein LOC108381495 n=1 Tax=Rhagoletis zephyria TaxID=28612 RepID=UPI0008116702